MGDVATNLVRGPFGGSLKKEIFVSHGHRVYEQQDAIYGNKAVARYFISQDKFDEMLRFSVSDGDFIVSCSGTIGKIYRMPTNSPSGVINQALLKITLDERELSPDYFLQYFRRENFQQGITDDTQGGAIKNLIGMEMFKQTAIKRPSLAEQTAIGKFFRTLDELAAATQRKVAGLKQLKAAYLQQMFPQAGERVPRVRFAGFAGTWEDVNLGDVADFSKGNGYSKGDLISKGTPIILYGRLYTKYETVIDNVDTFVEPKVKSVVSSGGEVIVPSSGETAEDISRASVVNKQGIILGGDLNIVKPNETVNPTFLAITISNGSQQKELSRRAQGKSVVHISNSDLKDVLLKLPAFPEQTAIGNFFRALDTKIAEQTDKAERLKQLKTAYLQKMFV